MTITQAFTVEAARRPPEAPEAQSCGEPDRRDHRGVDPAPYQGRPARCSVKVFETPMAWAEADGE